MNQSVLLYAALCVFSTCDGQDLSFPPGFKFGVASAAYQVEGAWNVSDKSESIWDRMTRLHSDIIADGASGAVACDSFHLWRRDLELLEELGVHYYRFSISWTRLLPSGFPDHVSPTGVRFYGDLIDALLERGIAPVVTLYHWDLPQSLQDLGGWTNDLIADWFADYARIVFSLFGDRVKTWLTLNEPMVFCDMAYNSGIMAPGIIDPELAPYICNKNALMAHAKAWRLYDTEFRPRQKGAVSLANQVVWLEPETPEDEELTELARENMIGRYAHPIYSKTGGWPPGIERHLAENSRKKGYPRPSLPPFTKDEIEFVKGTYDYFGLNFYTSRVLRPATKGELLGFWPLGDAPDLDARLLKHPQWRTAQAFWYYVNPEGMRKQLVWLKQHYGDIEILITENGYPTAGGVKDVDRVDYYQEHMKQVLLAIKDGVNVTGYTAWTLMDNFEWMDGYTSKFGLYEVDFDSPNRTRTPRSSAKFYSSVIKAHSLEVDTASSKFISPTFKYATDIVKPPNRI